MSTTTSAEETQGAEPFGWAVSGCHGLFKGEHAEQDAKAEAKRCSGTAEAFALFTHPTPPPADHVEDVRRMAPMTENQIHHAKFANSDGSTISFARAIEQHHGIGVKP